MKIYIDGEFVEKAEAKISVFDHGFLYGDGVFEGIRLYRGNVFRLEEHLKRFEDSAHAVMIRMPLGRSELREAICEACRINGLVDGYIRLVLTRGVGSLGLSPKECPNPSIIIIADAIQLYPDNFYTEGLKIITVPTRRTGAAALPPMVKSLNYLNNIMAKLEAQHCGYHEAIMLNDAGYVAECTGDNLFIFQGRNARDAALLGGKPAGNHPRSDSRTGRARGDTGREKGPDPLRRLGGGGVFSDRHGRRGDPGYRVGRPTDRGRQAGQGDPSIAGGLPGDRRRRGDSHHEMTVSAGCCASPVIRNDLTVGPQTGIFGVWQNLPSAPDARSQRPSISPRSRTTRS